MGIKATFSRENVQHRFDAFLDTIERKQVERLQMLGEMCVTQMRNEHPNNWQDQTGNLRSSCGYMVFRDGVAMHASQFDQIPPSHPQNGDVYDGGKIGKELCERIGKDTSEITLVVVAGMNYALYVESKGWDVITGAEQLAKRELPRMLEKLVTNIKRAAE